MRATTAIGPLLPAEARTKLWDTWSDVPISAARKIQIELALIPHPSRVAVGALPVRLALRLAAADDAWPVRVGAWLTAAAPADLATWEILERLTAEFTGTMTELVEAVEAVSSR